MGLLSYKISLQSPIAGFRYPPWINENAFQAVLFTPVTSPILKDEWLLNGQANSMVLGKYLLNPITHSPLDPP